VVPPLAGAVTAVIVAGAVVRAGAVGMVVVKVGAVTVFSSMQASGCQQPASKVGQPTYLGELVNVFRRIQVC
jgi:hypothetical protein